MTITVSVKATQGGPAPQGPITLTPVLPKGMKPAAGTFPTIVAGWVTWNIGADQPVKENTYIAIVPKPASGKAQWVNDDGHGNNPVYEYIGNRRTGTRAISIPVFADGHAYGGDYVAMIAEEDRLEAGAESETITVTPYRNPA